MGAAADARLGAEGHFREPGAPSADGNGSVPVTVPDSVQVVTELENGGRGLYHLSGVCLFGPGHQIHLYGSEGTIKYEISPIERLLTARAGDSQLLEFEVPQEKRGGWRVEAEFIGAIRGNEKVRFTDFATGMKYMEFTEAVAQHAHRRSRLAAAAGIRAPQVNPIGSKAESRCQRTMKTNCVWRLRPCALAARVCRNVQEKITPDVLEKDDRSPVTVADFASQAVIGRAIGAAFPGDPIIGEEESSKLRQEENSPFLDRILAELRGDRNRNVPARRRAPGSIGLRRKPMCPDSGLSTRLTERKAFFARSNMRSRWRS